MQTSASEMIDPVLPDSRKSHEDPTSPRDYRRSERSPTQILFYDAGKPYYEFTNFARHSVQYEDKTYATSEHLFQAFKFLTDYPDLADELRRLPTPRDAFNFARQNRAFIRRDWMEVRVQMMKIAVDAKFRQHDDLRQMLLDTQDAELIEDSPIDAFWGCGSDKTGVNMLGQILMALRAKYRSESFDPPMADEMAKYNAFCQKYGLDDRRLRGKL